jgi:multiple sugar transport system ATP-binding protein
MRVYDRPATTFVGGFIGTPPMNFLPGRVQREDGRVRVRLGSSVLDGPAALAQLATPDVLVGIRAENVEVSAGQVSDALAACIDVAEPMGTNLLLTLVVGDQHLKVLARNDFPARPGQAVWIRPDPDKLRWFDAQTRTAVGTT